MPFRESPLTAIDRSRSALRNRKVSFINKPFLVGAAASALLLASHLPVQAALPAFIGNATAAQSVDFIVKLPLRSPAELEQLVHLQSSVDSPLYHHFLSPAQFRASFAPAPATFAKAEAALRANGFVITHLDSQMLHVRGTAAAVNRAFHTQLGIVRADHLTRLAARSPLTVPAGLNELGATVHQLAATRGPQPLIARSGAPLNRESVVGPYWFDDLKQAYDYPSYTLADGKGVTIATVGASDYSSADAAAYFSHEKLSSSGLAPAPKTGRVLLGGAPFDPTTGISDEADLDIQQSGGSAPGATIIGIATGDPEFLDAYAYVDDNNFADIVSTSYGECELYYTAAYQGVTVGGMPIGGPPGVLKAYHELFLQGNAQGITFVFSSGDNSGTQCLPLAYFSGTGKTYAPLQHGAGIWVDDPNTTGVGGTNLITYAKGGSLKSTYASENEIGDRITTPLDFYGTGNTISGALWGSSGGPSSVFAKPSFQNLIPTGYGTRTVPDIAMQMGGCPFYGPGVTVTCGTDRDSAVYAVVGGELGGFIGTSASSPEFAGLLAVKESVLKSRLGNVNEDIYRLAAAEAKGDYFHQGIPGYNGVVRVTAGQKGYNPIIGVGTPVGNNFVGLPGAALTGDPQTPSNP